MGRKGITGLRFGKKVNYNASIIELHGYVKSIFETLYCDKNKCEEKGTVVKIETGNFIHAFTLLCMDNGEMVHRCDCTVFGIINLYRNLTPFIAIIELKSHNYNIYHAIDQIMACESILNQINQDFCSKFILKGKYYPIIAVQKVPNTMIYKMITTRILTFHGKKGRLRLVKARRQDSRTLETIIRS